MRTIYKVQIPVGEASAEQKLPGGAVPIHVEEQDDCPTIWFLIPNHEFVPVTHRFAICGTGQEAPAGKYLGTSKHQGGALMLHVFEV